MLVYAYENNPYVISDDLDYMLEHQLESENASIIEYEVDDNFIEVLFCTCFQRQDKLKIAALLATGRRQITCPFQVEYYAGTSEILPKSVYEAIQWLHAWFQTDDTKYELRIELHVDDKEYVILLERRLSVVSILINSRKIVKEKLRPYSNAN